MRKLICALLSVLLAACPFMSPTVLASEIEAEISTDMVDTSWYNEENDSFNISTAAQLAGLGQIVNSGTDFCGKTILLKNSIDLSNYAEGWNDGKGWIPIGQENTPFKGEFNGNNKTITGLYINNNELDYTGLFGIIDGGKVNNLGLLNTSITGQANVGGITGMLTTLDWNSDTPSDKCSVVKNCFVTGTIEGMMGVGGIAGVISYSYINECYSSAEVKGHSAVGGIIGDALYSGVENCYTTGSISGETYVGGIAGVFGDGSIFTCYATGAISGGDCIGGIVGIHYDDIISIIRQCTALNHSIIGSTNVGRIAGCNEGGQLNSNMALEHTEIFEGDAKKVSLLNAHNQIDGEDIRREDSLKATFWLDSMEYRPNVFSIEDGSYPVLFEIIKNDVGFCKISFVDWDGYEMIRVLIPRGATATAPTAPVREGYIFTGWDRAFENVSEDMTVTATYRWTNPFVDVAENTWFYDAVEYAYSLRLMQGISDTSFNPNGIVSRAMVATVLYRIAGEQEVFGGSSFTDVSDNKYYTDAVAWAEKNGIVNGYPDRTFRPNANVTREQLATIIHRFSNQVDEGCANLDDFPDSKNVHLYARKAMEWAVGKGLINGVGVKGTSYLQPTGDASRAQFAMIIYRYLISVEYPASSTQPSSAPCP